MKLHNSFHVSFVPRRWARFATALAHLAVAFGIGVNCNAAWSKEPASLTGRHQQFERCTPKRTANTDSLFFRERCYEGHSTERSSTELELVQNGKLICGRYTGCGGANCSRVYGGEVVGVVSGHKVTLYASDGHIESGEAIVDTFVISDKGELLSPTTRKRLFVKTPLQGDLVEMKASCRPKFAEPVRLKNYALIIQGDRPAWTTSRQPEKAQFSPPRPFHLRLIDQKDYVKIRDAGREQGNLIPRVVWIENKSRKPWLLRVEPDGERGFSDPACAAWLEPTDKSPRDYVWLYDETSSDDSDQIRPGSKLFTKLCAGDSVVLKKIKIPACPIFQCLDGCKC